MPYADPGQQKLYWATRYKVNPERKKRAERHLIRTYGINQEQFDHMVTARAGRCDLCHCVPARKLWVDHDHQTGKIRGLLCATCNTGLGQLGDTIAGLQRAIEYLKGTTK